ncbi:MAG TPA: hypothetical protein P5523_03775 [Bacteroidales bacterium]|mgnify:CR=1 FL=1|nr:hypothetical protein [Bacteroidales bacterium]
MPRITPIQSQVRSSGPVQVQNAKAEDFGGGIANAVQGFSKSVEKTADIIGEQQSRSEVSDLTAKMAKAQADFAINWAETMKTADPADKELSTKFLKGYDDYMSKIGEGVSTEDGKNYFVRTNATMRSHFMQSAYTGQAQLAGIKAREDYTGSVNNFSNSLMADPSSFETVRDMHDTNLEDLVRTGGMTREVALQLKTKGNQQIAEASVRGWANLNPEYAKQQLDQGRYDTYFSEDQKKQMYGEVETAIRGRQAEAERQIKLREEELKRAQMETENQFIEKVVNKQLSSKEILASNLDARQKEHYINLIKKESKESDPSVFNELLRRANLPDGDPAKLVNEKELVSYAVNGLLSYNDLNDLRKEVQGKRTEQGKIEDQAKNSVLKQAESMLVKKDPLTGLADPDGLVNYQRFVTLYWKKWEEGRKAGKTVEQLTDPSSPDWLGKYVKDFYVNPIEASKKSVDRLKMNRDRDFTNATANTPTPATPINPDKLRLPGETIQQWRDRTKGK